MDKDKVINILTGKEITSYKDDNSIKDNKNKLIIVDYTFEFTNDNYYLKNIKINNQ